MVVVAVLAKVHSENKTGAAPHYKGGCGFRLMVCSVAGGEPLWARLRPGNAAANDISDCLEVIDAAVSVLPAEDAAGHREGDDWSLVGRPLVARIDFAGCTAVLAAGLRDRNIGFMVTARSTGQIAAAVAKSLADPGLWAPAETGAERRGRRGAEVADPARVGLAGGDQAGGAPRAVAPRSAAQPVPQRELPLPRVLHRPARRGSYEHRVWAPPSAVDRVLARCGLALKGEPRPAPRPKAPWPDWCQWQPNQLWCWDASQFERCATACWAHAIVGIVSRKWIAVHLTASPDPIAARVLFTRALQNEGLLTDDLADRTADPGAELPDDNAPLLLAISDNGAEMCSDHTRRFMALCSIAKHLGRPSTPTGQAWTWSLWGCAKHEHPHLEAIADPAVLSAQLERIRVHHNSVRLHEAIGYVIPEDEHRGRAKTIRAARAQGMRDASQQRRAWHRSQK